ncbi:TIGR04255 family protein [Methanoculleus sp. FWC-SCC1]|uniref:TIGR04255 family protein n=1 Tax=Methanoculleus frigidifontis TaxID=2584085 RepID=A0ABT8M7Z3_9EURY|nr:TIGR04255 family protein [Methanoculleus sp. FWC-SCC1]MDN7024019.1 TIGR04255 family protein [Methanoculleus sp. FWC-SCC1]
MSGYRNPPVIEAVCEFRFPPDTPWDAAIPERLYERLKEEFPHREVQKGQELEITQGNSGVSQKVISVERTILYSENRKILLHIGNHILAINCLQPYPSWKVFQPKIQQTFNAIQEVTGITGIDRIGLMYLDKIEIPEETGKLKDYFNFHPGIGEHLPQKFVNFIVGCDFPFADMRDICRLQLTRAMQEKPGNSAFILTTDYFLAKRQAIAPDEVFEWLENAHREVREIFEGSVTDKLRSLFDLED